MVTTYHSLIKNKMWIVSGILLNYYYFSIDKYLKINCNLDTCRRNVIRRKINFRGKKRSKWFSPLFPKQCNSIAASYSNISAIIIIIYHNKVLYPFLDFNERLYTEFGLCVPYLSRSSSWIILRRKNSRLYHTSLKFLCCSKMLTKIMIHTCTNYYWAPGLSYLRMSTSILYLSLNLTP